MAQTIETFVEKLHAEGVQAGRDAAEKLRSEAQAEAERVIAEANKGAEAILAEARAEAQRNSERERSELDLAARDMVLRIREGLGNAVGALLRQEVSKPLADTEFLTNLIRDVVDKYAQSDARADEQIEICVNDEAMASIAEWAVKYLSSPETDKAKAHVDLKGTLKGIGFEYCVAESTVEVTVESVVAVLTEQVSPHLREVLDRALSKVAV